MSSPTTATILARSCRCFSGMSTYLTRSCASPTWSCRSRCRRSCGPCSTGGLEASPARTAGPQTAARVSGGCGSWCCRAPWWSSPRRRAADRWWGKSKRRTTRTASCASWTSGRTARRITPSPRSKSRRSSAGPLRARSGCTGSPAAACWVAGPRASAEPRAGGGGGSDDGEACSGCVGSPYDVHVPSCGCLHDCLAIDICSRPLEQRF
mmetsp:Transcript_109509/g.320519  ORF Transcript_109509/g.320519 Transcript_109509/m.320519 type:complete len:209 (-) Transcript_109509:67-693(-)